MSRFSTLAGRGGRGNLTGSNVHPQIRFAELSSKVYELVLAPSGESSRDVVDPNRPSVVFEPWRMDTLLLAALVGINTNHFMVDTTRLPDKYYQYNVKIYRRKQNSWSEDIVNGDIMINFAVLIAFKLVNANCIPAQCELYYDGKSTIFASARLAAIASSTDSVFKLEDNNVKLTVGGSPPRTVGTYKVVITEALSNAHSNEITTGPWSSMHASDPILRVLQLAIINTFSWNRIKDDPQFYITSGAHNVFPSYRGDNRINLGCHGKFNGYIAYEGYSITLQVNKYGLNAVIDTVVSCFVEGGMLIEIMLNVVGCRTVADLIARWLDKQKQNEDKKTIEHIIKNVKCKLMHLGNSRKIRDIGPAANSEASKFDYKDVKTGKITKITVDQYFEKVYGKLNYPGLPTINVGAAGKSVLIPAEHVFIMYGQCRNGKVTGEMTRELIKASAVAPQERYDKITTDAVPGCNKNIVEVINSQGDAITTSSSSSTSSASTTAIRFGLANSIQTAPIALSAVVLPAAKLQYGSNRVLDSRNGDWKMSENDVFIVPPTQAAIGYGVLVVLPSNYELTENRKQDIDKFITEGLINCASGHGISMRRVGQFTAVFDTVDEIKAKLLGMKFVNSQIVFVVMISTNCYEKVKFAAIKNQIVTQCMKYKNVEKTPKGYFDNILLKINTKLGGINHKLVNRCPSRQHSSAVFQDPPNSLCWILNEPTMFVGIDVSHPDRSKRATEKSVVAIVASFNGSVTKYYAKLAVQTHTGTEMVNEVLAKAMEEIFAKFKAENAGKMPRYLVVYRDGVSEGQFDAVKQLELSCIKDAIEYAGYTADSVKIAIIVCQKNHHTRLFLNGSDDKKFNVVPGTVVDARTKSIRTGSGSIVSECRVEWYLNSHKAVQGTSKPCKYTVVYDEIGFKLTEVELLTYWLCHLYCRANKAVSYATPAYYAHWASKMGHAIMVGSEHNANLDEISSLWSSSSQTMYFL